MTTPLPPGFVLENTSPPPMDMPAPPPGFQLEAGPAPAAPAGDSRSTLGRIGDRVSEIASGLSRLRMSDIVRGVAESGKSAVTLPGDVYAGRIDPNSDEAFSRVQDLASFASPGSAGMASRMEVAPLVTPITRDAERLGINLTAGQRTGNPALLSRENAAFGGGLGEGAQKTAQEAIARQQAEIFAARDTLGDAISGGARRLEAPSEAGGIVADAMRDAANYAKQGFQQRYDQALEMPGTMSRQFFEGTGQPAGAARAAGPDFSAPLSQRIADDLVNRPKPVIIDADLTPAASKALNTLDQVSNLQLGRIGQPGNEEIVGVSLAGIDQARKKLGAYYDAAKANPSDRRAVGAMIHAFDDQVERAVEAGLYQGDEGFVEAFKGARKSFSDYRKTFTPDGAGDDVGRAVERIIKRDPTPQEVANLLYGHSKVGATGLSTRLAERIGSVVGRDSDEWMAIRQGAWQRVTGVTEGKAEMSAKRISDRIYDFTRGEGASLAKQLFKPEEIKQMNTYASVLKATEPKAGTVNPSNSGNRTAALARQMGQQIVAWIGAGTGAVAGGPLGAAAGAGTAKGVGSIGDMLAASRTRRLYNGEVPVPLGEMAGNRALELSRRVAVPAVGNSLLGQREIREQR